MSAIKNTHLELDKRALANRFGSRAESYEAATPVQQVMGQCLLDKIRRELPDAEVQEILEVGCGTGRLTNALKALFPSANITAIDISQEMIDYATEQVPGPDYLVIDAEEYLQSLNRQFDLIVSNATVQWFVHLDKAIERMCSVLAPGGFLALGTFAERTFCELADAFNCAYQKNQLAVQNHVVPMKSVDYLRQILPEAELVERDILAHFADVRTFLQSIKDAGAVNSQAGQRRIPRAVLRDMPHYYEALYQKPGSREIQATYHTCFLFYRRPIG
ncbi:methyltransferase domain-containing protein [uncultured Porticoccus sp.]|uniref:methyltransferase domain-containing protein n=1 Tax=uncultured Porticoccus sp. TaxID=1256050 RepID=UPI0030DCEAF7